MEHILNFFRDLHSYIFDPERLPVAAAALCVVVFVGLVFGPLAGNANPLFWRTVDFLFGPMGSKLDKTERKAGDLLTRGTIITVTGMILSFLVGRAFYVLSHEYPNYSLVDIVALSLILGAGAGWYALLRLYKAMISAGGVKGAFFTLATSTRNNLATADEFTITRVGIGLGAKLFDKGVIGPILWYLIGGLPLAYLYAGLAALSWRFGKEGFTKGFGSTALALERLMGFVPNVFAGVLLSLAGLLTPTAGMTRSFMGLFRFSGAYAPYEQGGASITAMAHALNVSLGGATQDTDGSAIPRGWAGPSGATARLEAKHLHRALYILIMAHLLLFLTLLGAIILHGEGFFL